MDHTDQPDQAGGRETKDAGTEGFVQGLFDGHDGDQPYLVRGSQRLSRTAFRDSATQRSELFTGYGIGPGSTVGVQLPPSFTQVEIVLALWQLDAQVMLFDHRLKPAEVDALCATCRPQFMVRAGSNARATLGFRPTYEVVTEWRKDGLPAGTDHRLVQFSSGSTGLPKVIGRTPRSLAAEVAAFQALPDMPRDGERVLLLSSTAHSFGLVGGLLHALAAGVAVVFSPRVTARDILRTAAEHRVSAVFGVPMHIELLAAASSPPDLPSLRVVVSGGELMPPRVAHRFTETYGVPVGSSYGTTESGVIAMDVSGASTPAVGPPVPGMVLRERDGELDVALDTSPYLYDTGGTQYVDGWLRTRDRVMVDAAGAVHVYGRADSLVVVGGLKVDLTEVERVLGDQPQVDQAVVVHDGVVTAYVTPAVGADRPSSAELLRWCRERLADHKLPRVVRVLEALPRTSNGKFLRQPAVLREAAGG